MAQFIGKQVFDLLETALTSVFSTMRSGSNEVFLRTSFGYSKANLRKQLLSYFEEAELRAYDLKSRKKKDLWVRLIKQKKQQLFGVFDQKKASLNRDAHIDNATTCSNTDSSVNNTVPAIDWNESANANVSYRYGESFNLSAPYPTDNVSFCASMPSLTMSAQPKYAYYGNHRQCTECQLYINKVSALINANNRLRLENKWLKQMNHDYAAERAMQRRRNFNGNWNGSVYFESTGNQSVGWKS